MIIPVWKKVGESTHLLAKKIGDISNTKATHTGTLDPMAEGVVLVLTAEDRYKKAEFSDNKKVYKFEVLFGVNTDTHDLLGLQTATFPQQLNISNIEKKIIQIIPSIINTKNQKQPDFSAQRIDGVSAFDKAKKGETIDQKENNITIFSLEIIDKSYIDLQSAQSKIFDKIKLIQGDFRQEEITQNWKKTFELMKSKKITSLPVMTFQTTVSKRTYIRALVRDLSMQLEIPATTFHIVRTKNGDFTRNDCKNN